MLAHLCVPLLIRYAYCIGSQSKSDFLFVYGLFKFVVRKVGYDEVGFTFLDQAKLTGVGAASSVGWDAACNASRGGFVLD